MIERQNYLDIKRWLEYHRDVRQLSEKTLTKYRGSIRHLLEWADDVLFCQAHKIRPVYPVYLRNVPVVRNYKSTGRTLSKPTQDLACLVARNFFTWACRALSWYRAVDPIWVETLRPGRQVEEVKERELYTLDEVLTITESVVGDGLRVRRDKAAVALLFLSGMRVGAFVTLPVMALDLDKLAVKQWPELGVATKNSKAATTYLLDIPELLDVVRTWDGFVRSKLPPRAPWYARLKYDPAADEVTLDEGTPLNARRRGLLAESLKGLCKSVGLFYRSPHKLRHGHAVYALKRARTVAEFKAVSQNLMHASLTITDGVYGVLTGNDVQSTIAGLTDVRDDQQAVVAMLESLLTKIKQGNGMHTQIEGEK